MAQDILQKVTFDATPAVVYRALMDEKQHSAFTGSPAKIDDKVGGKVSAHGDYIAGYNVELAKGERIVQAWRAGDWAKGAWSIARFELAPGGTGQTRLTFSQHGVPDENAKSIAQGWKDHYWKPLAAWLAKQSKAQPRTAKRAAKKKTKKK